MNLKQLAYNILLDIPAGMLNITAGVLTDLVCITAKAFLGVDLDPGERRKKQHISYGLTYGDIFLGKAFGQLTRRKIYLKRHPNDKGRHILVGGATRYGKTTWAANLAVNLFRAGYGAGYLDNSDGKVISRILNSLNDEELGRVVVLNYGNLEWPIPVELYRPRYQDMFYSDTITSMWLSFFESNLDLADRYMTQELAAMSCRAAFEDKDNTLLEARMLAESPSDSWVSRIKDRDTRQWFLRHYLHLDERTQQATSAALRRRMSVLNRHTALKHVIYQRPKHMQYWREWLDKGYLVLICVPDLEELGGEFGVRIIASLLLMSLWSAARSRADVPIAYRKPFYMVVDEPQTWLRNNEKLFDNLFSKGGKYGLYMVALLQSLEQLEKSIRRILIDNDPHVVMFGTSKDTLRYLDFGELNEFVTDLPPYHFVARINPYPPVLCRSIDNLSEKADRSQLIDQHSQLFGRHYKQVAADIAERESRYYELQRKGESTWAELRSAVLSE